MIHLFNYGDCFWPSLGFLHLICGFAMKSSKTVRMKTQRYLKMTQNKAENEKQNEKKKSGMKYSGAPQFMLQLFCQKLCVNQIDL